MMMRIAHGIAPEVRQLLQEDPKELEALLEEIHEEDLADLLEILADEEAAGVLRNLSAQRAAPILERLDEDTQEAIVTELGAENIAPILSEMSADDRTDLIEALPDKLGDTVLETLERVDPEAAAEVEQLAKWPEDSAGGLMTTDYVSVEPERTVAEVMDRIRVAAREAETIYYVYVVSASHRLLGVTSLRDLLLADGAQRMKDVMTESYFAVAPDTDQEEVARTMAKYDFNALPVVGTDRKLLGVITIDDVVDVLTQEQTEDVQKLGGVEPIEETYFQTRFWTLVRKRLVWLAVLFVGEFFTGSALRHYDKVLEAVEKLAFYVPLLISSGGNAGSQSSTLVIRGLATGDIKLGDWGRIFVRELAQGAVMGGALAALGMARVWAWGDGSGLMFTIGATLIGITTMGCVVGSLFPILLRRVGLDPATSSAPFIASLVDVLGIILYFSVAKLFLANVIAEALAK